MTMKSFFAALLLSWCLYTNVAGLTIRIESILTGDLDVNEIAWWTFEPDTALALYINATVPGLDVVVFGLSSSGNTWYLPPDDTYCYCLDAQECIIACQWPRRSLLIISGSYLTNSRPNPPAVRTLDIFEIISVRALEARGPIYKPGSTGTINTSADRAQRNVNKRLSSAADYRSRTSQRTKPTYSIRHNPAGVQTVVGTTTSYAWSAASTVDAATANPGGAGGGAPFSSTTTTSANTTPSSSPSGKPNSAGLAGEKPASVLRVYVFAFVIAFVVSCLSY
ncbi:hypothetical protein BJ742DRAFT_878829 [Cladochytrium replicatum]|nr:hypothetical protein BJ742DRAFT_878829 [Cladochytrium replicatum]